jgi:Protein of unknown function (DUF2914)
MKIRHVVTGIVFLILMFVPVSRSHAQVAVLAQANAVKQGITVTQAVICKDVVNHMPVAAGEVFPAGTPRLFCFTRVDGAEGETEIIHNWYYNGTLKASVTLPVRGTPWRTWSSKGLRPEWTGDWMVEVLAKDGRPLESVSFTIK